MARHAAAFYAAAHRLEIRVEHEPELLVKRVIDNKL
jgi:hypothetical protein